MKKFLLSLVAIVMMTASLNAMYIVGDVLEGGWDPAKGIEMTEVDGGWQWTGLVEANKWFTFATKLVPSGDWAEFNSSYRLNPHTNNLTALAGEYTLTLGGPDMAFTGNGTVASYFIRESNGIYTLTVTVLGDIPDPEEQTWSVVGHFNDWGGTPDFQMTEIRPGIWKATMYDFSGQFKFRANNDWAINFGADGIRKINSDGNYRVRSNGDNFEIPEEIEEVVFELDVNNYLLKVSGIAPKMLALRGSMNDWNFESSYLFQEFDGVYVLNLDEVEAGCQFKIANESWNETYSTEVLDMVSGKQYQLFDAGFRDNMGIGKSYSEVKMLFSLEDGYFCFYGEKVSAVAVAEIEAGNARYFTLQGMEVKNPNAGLFIRVIEGKSEKIIVK